MAGHVAVIGGGPMGLMAVKNLRDEGFEVTGFEQRSYLGGIWKPSTDSALSVVPGTVFNSSRFRSAISDFPFPDGTDDYPTNQQMYDYLQSYADHFDIRKHYRLNAGLKDLERENDKWALKITYNGSKELTTEYFDKVLVASGSFITPKQPKLKDMEKFKGNVMHSFDFRNHKPTDFTGKNVLIVGMHATAQDVVCELAGHARQIYLSHRNGLMLLSRYQSDGATFDTAIGLNFMRFQIFTSRYFPSLLTYLMDTLSAKMSKSAFPAQKPEWNLQPAPSLATTTPLVADALWPHLKSGYAEPVAGISSITGPNSILLSDSRTLSNIDTIIFCTGYHLDVPCIPLTSPYQPYPNPGKSPILYRNTFSMHPDPAVRSSLAFLGQAAVVLPGFVNQELQIMAVTQTWLGKSTLPDLLEMQRWWNHNQEWRKSLLAKQKSEATFYEAMMRVEDHWPWLDKAAGTGLLEYFNWFSWKSWKFWWEDREFYRLCASGLFSPAIWRLLETGGRKRWEGARSQIVQDNEIMEAAKREKKESIEREKLQKKTT